MDTNEVNFVLFIAFLLLYLRFAKYLLLCEKDFVFKCILKT